MNKSNCLICNGNITYYNETKEVKCIYCNEITEASTICENGHYVCDSCHSSDAFEVIKTYCNISDSTNPTSMMLELMKHPSVKMHGPEHHFLVPAVLTSAFLNKTNNSYKKESLINEAAKRAKNVLGGFCGFYGACGAGVGNGIFISLITSATPLTKESWAMCNLATSKSLEKIASFNGPRCCKRNSFSSIEASIEFVKDKLGVDLENIENIKCKFNSLNNECLNTECKYY